MKHLHEIFNDEEFEQLKQAKAKHTWHDFIMALANPNSLLAFWVKSPREEVKTK